MKKVVNQFSKKYKIVPLIIVGFVLILIGTFLNSYALTETVKSIFFSSQTLNYNNKQPGSIGITKSGEWIGKGKARITFDLDTILDVKDYQMDFIFVLDSSGFMQGTRLEKMKEAVQTVSTSLLSNPNNRIALITYDSDAELKTGLTNDKEKIMNQIESISRVEDRVSNYYQGLLKVGDMLMEYQKEKGRECVVLFLASGSPNKDSPNQATEYDYLKSRYPYLKIRGIQYAMYDKDGNLIPDAIPQIKRISDTQYIADPDTIEEVLTESTIFPISYEELRITDRIDSEYFDLSSISNLKSTDGKVQLERKNGQIIWNLEGLSSGRKESLSFEVDLKNEYIEQEGFYSTNEGESLTYKIEEIEETIERTETPILSNYYTVEYDSNLPTGCSISTIPESSRRIVYDVVEISEEKPSCEGYSFDGWKVVSEGAWQMNEDYFLMPESDVVLRAEWSKLSIVKMMDGEVHIVYPPIIQFAGYDYGGTDELYNDRLWKYRNSITKVIFQDNIKSLNNEKEVFDVSAEQNGSVIARITTNPDNSSLYTAYIQGEGGVIANEDSSNLFDSFSKLESIEGLEYFDTSNVRSMDGMFSKCTTLKKLDLSSLNTSNVEIMTFMFLRDTNLTEINLNGWDTRKVTNMKHMFRECSALESLDITHFVTDQVTDMQYMFYKCEKISNVNLSSFDTSQVTNMHSMFDTCKSLATLDVSNFNTSKVTNMCAMFCGCNVLSSLDIRHFDTSKVTDMAWMFCDCNLLSSLDVSNFDTQKVITMVGMFSGCSTLTELDLHNFNTSKVVEMNHMFNSCAKLEKLNLSNFDTRMVTEMKWMFQNCSNLLELDLSNFDTSKVTSLYSMFEGCRSLKNLNISNFNTSNVTDMSVLFRNCWMLKELDLRNFNTEKVIKMDSMFAGCYKLEILDISSFNTSNVTNMQSMFDHCMILTNINISNFDTSKVSDMSWLFSCCYKLTEISLHNFNTSNVTSMENMFQECISLESMSINNFDTSKVSLMNGMFQGCSSLTDLDLRNFNTSMVTNMTSMFQNCSSMKTLDISNFDIQKVTSMESMFQNCSNLTLTMKIDCALIGNYSNMFLDAATETGSGITVNYTSATSDLVDRMIATKSATSNVVKGTRIA